MNNGGIRANLRAGPASYGTLFEIQPFANILYRVTVSGKSLRAYLEKLVGKPLNAHISGVTITFDSTKAPGARIVSARLADGKEIREDAQYALILNDFLATGGDGLGVTTGALRTEILPIVDLDALVEYLKSRPQPVQAPADARIIVVPPAR
jgi:5'-nucleotidase